MIDTKYIKIFASVILLIIVVGVFGLLLLMWKRRGGNKSINLKLPGFKSKKSKENDDPDDEINQLKDEILDMQDDLESQANN